MITQELISYIKGELNKGKTREDVRSSLLQGGGWTEQDLSEAFRTVMPIQPLSAVAMTPTPAPAPSPTLTSSFTSRASPGMSAVEPSLSMPAHHRNLKPVIFGLIVILVVGGGYFFRSQLGSGLDSLQERLGGFSFFGSEEDSKKPAQVVVNTPPPVTPGPINCGVTAAPDIKNQMMIEGDRVLECLGVNALTCKSATGVLADPLFPSIFEIVDNGGNCSFKLSYPSDSTLTSVTGKKLAGESIMCPFSSVRAFKEGNNKTLVFQNPTLSSPAKYGAEAYFYATTGLFIERNFNPAEIQGSLCTGSFITSVIDSYNLMKSKN